MYYKPHIKFVVAHSKGKMAKCLEMWKKNTRWMKNEMNNKKTTENKSEKDKKKHAYTQEAEKKNK